MTNKKNTKKENNFDNIITAGAYLAMVGLAVYALIDEARTADRGKVFSDKFAEQLNVWNQEWCQKKGTVKCHNRDYQAYIMPKINEYFGIATETTED